MNKQACLKKVYNSTLKDELEKISARTCPGSKIRSKGMGCGMGVGKGSGPVGIPVKEKEKMMSKKSMLENIYNSSLQDELKKIAQNGYKYYCPSCDYENDMGGICPVCGDIMVAYDDEESKESSLKGIYNSSLKDELRKIAQEGYKYYCPSCDYKNNTGGICPKCGDKMVAYGKEESKEASFRIGLKKLAEILDSKQKGFVTDIESDTVSNSNFRKVLYTGKTSQLVLMSLNPNEEIGEEVHPNIDQFFRIDDGSGEVVINGTSHAIKNGSAFVIPQGAKHNVIAGKGGLKLYSLYCPPHHADGTIHKTKADAEKDKEKFDGKVTEG